MAKFTRREVVVMKKNYFEEYKIKQRFKQI